MPNQSALNGASASPIHHAYVAKAAAWLLMLSASLLNLLNFNNYDILRPEVGLIVAAFAAIAATLALLDLAAPRLAFVFTAALVALGVDLNSETWWLVAAAGVGALAAAWFNNTAVVRIATAAFGTVALFQLITGLSGGSAKAAAFDTTGAADRPPIVHILLDSYSGIEGMRAQPALIRTAQDTESLFAAHGFRLYNGAYSRHANTANSVPYALSFGTSKLAQESQMDKRATPEKLAYFQWLSEKGYKVSVLGADFIDLCSGQPIAACRQFPYSELSALSEVPLSTRDRAATIGLTLAGFSETTTAAFDAGQLARWFLTGAIPSEMRNLKKIGSLRSAVSMMELPGIFRTLENGQAYFVHLLVPHDPYVFDQDCQVLPRTAWTSERSGHAYSERIKQYGGQLACTNRLLFDIFDSIEAGPAGENAIVIVHGDHGSRIVRQRPTIENPAVSTGDYAMTYSTLFAVRAPGIDAGSVEGRASIDELLKGLVLSDFSKAPPANVRPAEVILATSDWIPKARKSLPKYGAR